MRVVSLNVVHAEVPDLGGAVGVTAIDKRPVTGRRGVTSDGVAGDHRSDMKNHGSTDHAVYAHSVEDYAWWAAQLGADPGPGAFGENLTTVGVNWNAIEVGTVVRIGTAVLQVSCPRIPCSTFGRWVDQEQWVKRFNDAGRWNTYLRVLHDGELGAGDDIAIESRPGHGVTVTDVARVYTGNRDHDRLVRVEACDDVDEATRAKARAALDS